MANLLGAGGRGVAQMRIESPHDLVFEEIVPSSGWTEDSDSHCLIIDLRGFKREEVKLQVDDYGHLIVSGERQVNEMKHVRFEQSYSVPANSNIEETTAKFEDGIVYIVIPKKQEAAGIKDDHPKEKANADNLQQEIQQNVPDTDVLDETKTGSSNANDDDDDDEEEEFYDAKIENQWSLLRTLRVQLMKNKGIFVTAVLAFSLGALVSQTFQANNESGSING